MREEYDEYMPRVVPPKSEVRTWAETTQNHRKYFRGLNNYKETCNEYAVALRSSDKRYFSKLEERKEQQNRYIIAFLSERISRNNESHSIMTCTLIDRAVEAKFNLNSLDRDFNSLLELAAKHRNSIVIAKLLRCGVSHHQYALNYAHACQNLVSGQHNVRRYQKGYLYDDSEKKKNEEIIELICGTKTMITDKVKEVLFCLATALFPLIMDYVVKAA